MVSRSSLLYWRGGSVCFGRVLLMTFFLAVYFFATASTRASDVYIAQSAAGSGNGADCADARAVSYLNSTGNWTAGTTFHLCGTFNFPAGANGITVSGSGTASSPISIVFEAGAVLQSPAFGGCAMCGVGGAIVINGFNYIVVDGKNTGIIQNTANGSSLTYQNGTIGVLANGDHLIVRNLTIQNMYVNSSTEPNNVPGFNSTDIQFGGNDGEICNNQLNNAHVGVWFTTGWSGPRTEGPTTCDDAVSANGVHLYNNYISDHGWMINVGGAGYANIYNNEMTNWANWFYPTNTAYAYHLDGIIAYGYGSGVVVKPYIYNNYIHGDFVGFPTGFIFCTYGNAGSGSACTIFNNLLVGTGNTAAAGQALYFHGADGNPLGPHAIYNNTIIGFNTGSIYSDGDTTQVYTVENNVFVSGGGWYYQLNSTPTSNFKSDYNVFYGGRNYAPNGGFSVSPVSNGGFAMWQAAGEDAHSVEANPKLNALYQIQGSSSVASNRGTNLTKLNINALDSGMPVPVGIGSTNNGGARSSSAPWDSGAFAGMFSANAPGPPSGLTATVQ